MLDPQTVRLAERVLELARARDVRLGTAESITGGLVAGTLTAVVGASDRFEGGVVTYTEAAKRALLDLPGELLAEHGTVSPETSRAMAEAALAVLDVEVAVAVTGYASPGPGVPDEAVGDVHTAVAGLGQTTDDTDAFVGDRAEVRGRAVHSALGLLVRHLEAGGNG